MFFFFSSFLYIQFKISPLEFCVRFPGNEMRNKKCLWEKEMQLYACNYAHVKRFLQTATRNRTQTEVGLSRGLLWMNQQK